MKICFQTANRVLLIATHASADPISKRLPDTRRKISVRPLDLHLHKLKEEKKRQTEASSPDVEVFQARHYTQQHAKFMQA